MSKTKEVTYLPADRQLLVYMRSTNPHPKGVRAKAQKFLKSKGIYDAQCWVINTEVFGDSSVVTLQVSSGQLLLKEMTRGVKL